MLNSMSRIRILSEFVASQIAAGEVVQRPASVVKELIDNSLDAGAGRVRVEIEKGGNSVIRVEDNGCGMSKDELPMSLRRHATSKIENESDLHAIQTYGFRGEALAAISSVSKVEIISRLPSERHGHRMIAVGGEVESIDPTAAPPGTVITVSDLFFNTPARRKFLKSQPTELERVSEVFVRAAITQPRLHFELEHNKRRLRLFAPSPSTLDRLVQVLGNELVGELLPVDYTNERVQITGFTSRATTHRNTASDLYFYVNQRFVRDRILLRALLEAYRASLPQRRYPVSVLFIDLPPDQVDVNVHPSKEEIRFRDERFIWSAVYAAIRETFETRSRTYVLPVEEEAPPLSDTPPDSTLEVEEGRVTDANPVQSAPPESPPVRSDDVSEVASHRAQPTSTARPKVEDLFVAPSSDPVVAVESINRQPLQIRPTAAPERRPDETTRPKEKWRAVAQIFDSYIIVESGSAMAVVDQHALHERLRFEKLRRGYETRTIRRQKLLVPMTVDAPPGRAGLIESAIPVLEELGLEIEPFGDATFVVRGIPEDLPLGEVGEFIHDVADDLSHQGVMTPLPDRAEKMISLLACRGSIKAGDPLTHGQMQDLMDRYSEDPALATCPHGRPPIWRITRKEVEKWFDRG